MLVAGGATIGSAAIPDDYPTQAIVIVLRETALASLIRCCTLTVYEDSPPIGTVPHVMSPEHGALGQRWTICARNHVHWGANGGAGLLLRYKPRNSEPQYLLARRSRWVDEGGTWGIPGGAITDGEDPETAARREAIEEIGHLPSYDVTGLEVQDCGGGWQFHIIKADVGHPFVAYSHQETEETGWFTVAQMDSLQLHSGIRRWLDERQGGRRID